MVARDESQKGLKKEGKWNLVLMEMIYFDCNTVYFLVEIVLYFRMLHWGKGVMAA